MTELWSRMGRRPAFKQKGRGGQRSVRDDGARAGPDERKFERDRADINGKIKELENKLKPVGSNATQLIIAEIAKETAVCADIEKAKEANATEIKATDAKIREIGEQYREKRLVANDLLAGVRHKTENRHDDAVERLQQQIILINRRSSVERMKYEQEIDALRKSKERLIEYRAAKSVVDSLKQEQEDCRAKRDDLHRQTKELRARDYAQRDKVANLKQELEEAKERKKVSSSERDEIRKEIDALYQKRRELLDLFRSEQLAFSEQLRQQSEVNRVQRDQNRAVREERRKYRAIEQTFHHKQQYVERIATCNALILHLQRLSITNSHTGVAALPEMDGANSSPPTSSTNLDSVPLRSESDPTAAAGASSNDVGGFILRRERDEVLVPPTIVSLKRKKSKKEKRRNVPIIPKKLNLNPIIFRQFGSLDLPPPSTLTDIPQVISQLQDKLTYLEGMTKAQQQSFSMFDTMIPADSGLGSTAPSEMLDSADYEATLTNSQEEMTLDPGLGSTVSPKRSFSEVASGAPKHPAAILPQRSATDQPAAVATSDDALVRLYDSVLPHNLVSMTSSSTNGTASASSIVVGGGEE